MAKRDEYLELIIREDSLEVGERMAVQTNNIIRGPGNLNLLIETNKTSFTKTDRSMYKLILFKFI
jgi:hypothetical protein